MPHTIKAFQSTENLEQNPPHPDLYLLQACGVLQQQGVGVGDSVAARLSSGTRSACLAGR